MKSLLKKCVSFNNTFARINTVRLASSKSDVQKKEEAKNVEDIKVKTNIVVEKFGAITTLNIDRQNTRNSLDEATLREMTEAINAFDKDAEAKVLVFNGEGGSFCSGFDLDEVEEKGYNTLIDAAARFRHRPLCVKPTIAAVSGYAVGEGFELALACDLRVIEDTAIIGCLGRRFGAPQSLYGARRLTSLIGLSRALDLLMTGRPISGTDANIMGLAHKLTTTGTALGESIKLAKSLVKFPQNALIMDKLAAVNSQLNPNSEESMRDEAIMNSLLGSALEDLKQGIKKFQGGIGKHGKFYKLSEVPLKDWELEESLEETTIKLDDENKDKKA
ncbi:probable enoyl-CoA hydratase [Bicyclus anynana]|uniref:Probable enoyl-CoA hydratase n=1 Tax=Bicyclus anynana TaxID=110368 RepID=A0ABM3LX03_BICAN|nr:probable enoyl-CoA hydratase [Bicyclus anynana]